MSDAQEQAQGKTVQVGLKQLNNTTPMAAKIVFRTVLYLSGLWALLAPSVTNIPPHILANVNEWLLVGNMVMNFTIQFFGWDFKDK